MDASVFFPFCKEGSGVFAYFSFFDAEVMFSYLASLERSSFSAQAFAILLVLHWIPKGQQYVISISISSSQVRFSLLRSSSCLIFSGISNRKYPFSLPLLSRYNEAPVTHFFLKITRPRIGLAECAATAMCCPS